MSHLVKDQSSPKATRPFLSGVVVVLRREGYEGKSPPNPSPTTAIFAEAKFVKEDAGHSGNFRDFLPLSRRTEKIGDQTFGSAHNYYGKLCNPNPIETASRVVKEPPSIL
jgi:hypothetical protein